jgi:ribosome-binding factor A
MRHTPELSFHYDSGLDATDRVAQLLEENRTAKPEREPGDETP